MLNWDCVANLRMLVLFQVEMKGLTNLIKFDNQGFRSDFVLDIIELSSVGIRKIGDWNSTQGVNFTRSFGQLQQDIVDNLKNKTLVVTAILVWCCLRTTWGANRLNWRKKKTLHIFNRAIRTACEKIRRKNWPATTNLKAMLSIWYMKYRKYSVSITHSVWCPMEDMAVWISKLGAYSKSNCRRVARHLHQISYLFCFFRDQWMGWNGAWIAWATCWFGHWGFNNYIWARGSCGFHNVNTLNQCEAN